MSDFLTSLILQITNKSFAFQGSHHSSSQKTEEEGRKEEEGNMNLSTKSSTSAVQY
ncbi:hypothetical protein RchiOBHm_Chr1g0336481 [Rosa chinensis]|uniref:Uncharacterized protein n=1 Tax=Rosa chinensis TaxID=74649 RepID=A0A2P6SCN7_ROSCH|nr:hypothetical protein RchiOBHm_Chr1g0336481 [Rosa chinensis]